MLIPIVCKAVGRIDASLVKIIFNEVTNELKFNRSLGQFNTPAILRNALELKSIFLKNNLGVLNHAKTEEIAIRNTKGNCRDKDREIIQKTARDRE